MSPTHQKPLSPEEANYNRERDQYGRYRTSNWYGGPRFATIKKYAHGKKHKFGRHKKEMINDSGSRS